MSEPIREFTTADHPYTPEFLVLARGVMERAQEMDWLAHSEPPYPHKMPCFSVANVEWLMGYIDALTAQLALAEAVIEADERLVRATGALVDLIKLATSRTPDHSTYTFTWESGFMQQLRSGVQANEGAWYSRQAALATYRAATNAEGIGEVGE